MGLIIRVFWVSSFVSVISALDMTYVKLNIPDHTIKVPKDSNQTVTVFSQSNATAPVWIHFDQSPDKILEDLGHVLVMPQTRNVTLNLVGTEAGKTLVNASIAFNPLNVTTNLRNAFVFVSVFNSEGLIVLGDIVGWMYFAAWSVSFYPQIYENWKRKSVIGLNFDFLSLNLVGFLLYSLFNLGLYANSGIQLDYFENHPEGVNPVKLNDVVFSVHAVFACVITIFQCLTYERGNQSVSKSCRFLHCGILICVAIALILAIAATSISWLEFLYICSYVKLFITLVKYVPQAFMNFRRKSTMGWSIGNVLLDFTGGLLSIIQMFIIAYNFDDWSSIFGDPTKFGLGLFSVLFDIFFMLQHYVFYRNRNPHEELINDQEIERENEEDESTEVLDQPQ